MEKTKPKPRKVSRKEVQDRLHRLYGLAPEERGECYIILRNDPKKIRRRVSYTKGLLMVRDGVAEWSRTEKALNRDKMEAIRNAPIPNIVAPRVKETTTPNVASKGVFRRVWDYLTGGFKHHEPAPDTVTGGF